MAHREYFVERAAEALEEKRRVLLRRWRDALADEQELLQERQIEWEDASTDQREAALIDLLGERELAQLEAIAAAMERIDQGRYGTCARCKGPIAEARLRALPEAELCIDCMEMDEEARHPLPGRASRV